MKQYMQKLKTKKRLTILSTITFLSILLGIFYFSIITKNNKELVATSLAEFFLKIKKNQLNYQKSLIISTANITITSILIWLIGISIIGIPIIIATLIFKSFLLGFSFISIVYNYKIPGILLGIIYILPHIMKLFAHFVLSYYAISFSLMLFQLFFRKKEYNKKILMKRYTKMLITSLIISMFGTMIEIFAIPAILKIII